MILMLLDHVRETFYLHLQVSDPVNVFETSPELFYTRFVTFICAPVFIYLTGLSSWLFLKKNSRDETSKFLLKRGLFLVLMEITVINFLWGGQYPPDMFFLQVIWCIGICMRVYICRRVCIIVSTSACLCLCNGLTFSSRFW